MDVLYKEPDGSINEITAEHLVEEDNGVMVYSSQHTDDLIGYIPFERFVLAIPD